MYIYIIYICIYICIYIIYIYIYIYICKYIIYIYIYIYMYIYKTPALKAYIKLRKATNIISQSTSERRRIFNDF